MKTLTALKEDGLRGRSIRGALLTGLNFGSQNALRLAGNLVLTRLLFPEAFGIMALVQVFLTGLNMFSDLGVRASIVQNKQGAEPLFLDTAWVFQIGRGFVLWGATCLLAKPMSVFYDAPILYQLLPVAGFVAVIQGFNSTKMAMASREIKLGRLTVISMTTRFLGLLAIVLLAWWWQSVWALAIGSLVAPLITLVASHLLMPGHNNRFRFDPDAAKSLIKFGKFIFISTLAGFMISQADRAILGKFITLSELAYYNIAFFLATVPRMIAQRLSDAVLFPLYSRRPPAESVENYRNLAKARLGVVGATFAIAVILALAGDLIIRFLYDARYASAGPLLVLMAVANLPKLVTSNYGSMLLARGDSKRFAVMMVCSAMLQTGILVLGIINFGILGAVFTPFVAGILFYPVSIWFIRPYKGWMPGQDLLFGLITCVIGTLAVWINFDAIRVPVAAALAFTGL
ncbi:oligosaccharide flippase family protein [Octadecabacter sp. 1_MG-2023]|uniref:oligosaccharide flippase family protein n=1 Tax=unclassified Octadecabacter TaxID=196158 RepID=UPI001C08B5B1|nr:MULTISPECIES: oligosaccharide flippase family protein [unclassified Octadecabacter]MBU2994051.1 oligosaccharide flippase family protein [Octadecabacter sp. B2R22]MDO6736095.1 oligosaccharide flippase family protein [Octadecabacter sp. 1_MG-2023]